ncbi:WLM-domain-containing protein [Trichodelitschia bisporula]|uniref:WLM-domain-containing protein n=1 Tax=Trichodelitschia bisporula TaxID=703511 RepID=A0A6G1HVL7_9PEZI|nr:WLM-domain-containing protein [Trichodelitschia bisporula]
MPLGITRLNERTQRPNALINFIKPLPGSTSPTSEAYLNAVAAIVYPIMKTHHLALMSLEEHAWNKEFLGRNFNAGEVVQLVLRDRGGGYLPIRHVEMVVIHELAHCDQMNHSRAFWAVRDKYAEELRELWAKGYTGEGMWGRGTDLLTGRSVGQRMPDADVLPEHLCGGTYRSWGRKRKRKGTEAGGLTSAEKRQRRILKKFGPGGMALGADENTRLTLEAGKGTLARPRVAGSARGRELRAAAALARFGKEGVKEESSESETEDEYEVIEEEGDPALDGQGKKILDAKGRGMRRVCGSEDQADEEVKREMQELWDPGKSLANTTRPTPYATIPSRPQAKLKTEPKPSAACPTPTSRPAHSTASNQICAVCSLANAPDTLFCTACFHVLDTERTPNHWRCQSAICQGGIYVNMGDFGRCQICGEVKK